MFKMVNQLNLLETVPVGGFQAYIGLSGTQNSLQLPSNNYFWYKNNNPYEFDHYLRLIILIIQSYHFSQIVISNIDHFG